MSKKDLKKPSPRKRPTADEIDAYVSGGAGKDTEAQIPVKTETARLTVDLPQEQHRRFKVACALAGTEMANEIRQFIDRRCAELEASGK